MPIKRAAVINDISCVGKCSLTVTIPILSALGVEVCPVPTAVLSTHTEFPNPTFRNLSDDIKGIVNHWKTLGVPFDAVYSGYLAGEEQIDIVSAAFDTLDSAKLRLVDPVMGDSGFLYSKFSQDFPLYMRKLCKNADIIVPNITEISAMCEIPFHDGLYTEGEIEGLIEAMKIHTAAKMVLTGVELRKDEVGIAIWDGSTISFYSNERICGRFSGTGDIFASVLLGMLLNNRSLFESAISAADFTGNCIRNTLRYENEQRFGVMFEDCLPSLYSSIQK